MVGDRMFSSFAGVPSPPLGPISVTPSSVSSSLPPAFTQTFTFTFADPGLWAANSVADVLINNYLDSQLACYFAIVPSGPTSGYLVPRQ
jgi:hypothetical protein